MSKVHCNGQQTKTPTPGFLNLLQDALPDITRRAKLAIYLPEKDDVLHDALVALIENFEKYDPTRSFTSWAMGFVDKKALEANRHRQAARKRTADVDVNDVPDDEGGPHLRDGPDYNAMLAGCLEKMKAAGVDLSPLDHYYNTDAAKTTKPKTPTTDAEYMRRFRVMEKLRECVNRKIAAAQS